MIKTLSIGDLVIGSYASGFLLEKHSGFGMPSVRVDMKDRGHYHGANLGYSYYGKRGLTIEGEIVGLDMSDYEAKRRLLAETFDIMKGEQTLFIETQGGLTVQIDVILANALEMPYEKGKMVRGKFQIGLMGAKPWFESIFPSEETVTLFNGGGFAIPFAIPLAVDAGSDAEQVLDNEGNGFVFPIITVYGAATNPTIVNASTDQTLNINHVLDADDYIEIDTYNRTAMLNGETNITNEITGDWMILKASGNDIKLSMTSPDTNAKAVFSWRNAYIGL